MLICTDNMSVVSYINHQGGVCSRAVCTQAASLLWVDCHLLSIRAAHIPGLLNRGADMLSRNNLALPAALLAVSCPADGGCSDIALTKSQTSRVNILPLVLCKIKEERALVIFIALNWSNQPWFPDLREIQIWLPLGEFPSGGTCCLK